jgi:hypothetical protein
MKQTPWNTMKRIFNTLQGIVNITTMYIGTVSNTMLV